MSEFIDYGIDVDESASGNVKTTCPECSASRKKSGEKCLSVDVKEGVWLCHHCGWSGGLNGEADTKEYHREPWTPEMNQDFAYQHHWTELPVKVMEWFQQRGITGRTLIDCRIGYGEVWMPQVEAKRKAIAFPYFYNNELVNVKYRDGQKNFRQEKNALKMLWNIDNITDEVVVITEGEVDAMSFIEAGYPSVVSVPDGAPSPNAKNLDNLFPYLTELEGTLQSVEQFILAVDADQPGQVLQEELARRLGKERCWVVQYPEGTKDANEVLQQDGVDGIHRLIGEAEQYPIDGLYTFRDLEEEILELYDEGLQGGVSTGWPSLDNKYTVRTQEMTICTGFPGHGKTAFIDALAVNLYKNHGWKFAFCSPENLPLQRHMALISQKVLGKPFHRGPTDRMSREKLRQTIHDLSGKFNFILLQDKRMSIDNIMERAKSAIYRHGIKGFVLDPWNELDHQRNRESQTIYISDNLTRLRRFARANDIHLWVIAHPTKPDKDKEGKYRVPNLYNVSGSATWYDKADNGITVWRPNKEKDITEVYVTKIRFSEVGEPGKTLLKFNRVTQTYVDPAQEAIPKEFQQ